MQQSSNFDNVTFTVITQVLPLLALFGQDLTNDYLSQTVNWFDYVVFAVGPLGVGWAVIATIRALGPKWLKGRIGKSDESEALVERDLMSSTSDRVCELWDGEKVVREIRPGKIKEFLLLDGDIWKPDDGRNAHFDTDPETKWASDFDLEKSSGLSPPLSSYEKTKHKSRPPNLSLNLGPYNRERFSLLAVIIALVLQSGFLILTVTLTYEPDLSGQFPVPKYTFLSTLIGTVLLSLGLVLGAKGIDNTSTKIVWKRLPGYEGDSYILWIQRGLENDTSRYSSCVLTKQVHEEILESHYRHSFRRTLPMRSLSVTAVACIIAGYVLQVIGVSGMHYPVQVTLFGITIIMTGIRVVLRPTPSPLTARITRPKHEMDWLAVTQLFRPKDLISPEHKNHRPAPTWTINGGQTWRCSTHIPEEPSVNTTDLIYLRNKIGNECKWDSPGMEEVSHAIHAIETIARSLQKENLIPDSCSSISCSIPVDLGSKLRMENFTFCVKRDIEGGSNIWKVDSESDLSSALSLWLFYDKENTLTEERENDLSIFFLGSNERMHEVRNSWDSQPGLPAAQPDFCRRVRYVKITEDESSKSTYPGPQPVNVKRNMIAGFQEGLHLHPPNFHYNLHRATVQLDIETRDLSVHFADNVSENAQTKETSGAGDGNSAPAIVETANIAKLYARHLVSAFMWAIAQHISDAGRDIVSKKEFYKQLAGQVALTGLLDEEDALLVILPPLVQPRIIESSQLRPHNGSYQQGSHWWQK